MDFQRKPSWADLDSDDIASIASDDLAANRPNRWTGPKSTWRHLTEHERLLWQSMARLRDQDLGVHLYNAFALKQQAKDPETARFLTVKLVSFPFTSPSTCFGGFFHIEPPPEMRN